MHFHADSDTDCGHELPEDASFLRRYSDLINPVIAGVALLVGWVLDLTGLAPHPVVLGFYAVTYVAGGYELLWASVRGVARLVFDIDLLMLIAGIGAAILGKYAEGGLLFFLFSLGHALEHYAMGRARNAIRSLGSITPKTAVRIDGEQEQVVPIFSLAIGDRIRIRPNTRVAADGVIEEGRSSIDQSTITGESTPVERAPGERIFAGSLNGANALVLRVDRLAEDSTMARMITLVEEARRNQGSSQQFTRTFTRIFVPTILISTLALLVLPPLFGALTLSESLLRSLTVLVAASPCALAISTPSAVLAGIAQAARNGVLVKGGRYLEELGQVRSICLDKTGTLTRGRPEIESILVNAAADETEVLRFAGALEHQSTHPIAKAISRAVKARSLDCPIATELTDEAGFGVRARVDEATVRVGGTRLLEDPDLSLDDALVGRIEEIRDQGLTVMLVIREQVVLGVIGLFDRPRPEARTVVERLHSLGVKLVVMLPVDNDSVAQRVGGEILVDAIRSNLLPEHKIEVINSLQRRKRPVAMVGDGVNDAPALAAAKVGIAMGAGGTDVALETADVALMADDLSKLPFAIGLSRRVRRTILQNFVIALSVIGILVPFAALGLTPMWIAVVFHEGSTLVVVANALRLLVYEDRFS
ncbi:MAG: heavy metal translocating P-type ATPase [Planctomycetota bacterium]|nr:heavy metal translocating P-type ATPase [Planctomycetota bacterium]